MKIFEISFKKLPIAVELGTPVGRISRCLTPSD